MFLGCLYCIMALVSLMGMKDSFMDCTGRLEFVTLVCHRNTCF